MARPILAIASTHSSRHAIVTRARRRSAWEVFAALAPSIPLKSIAIEHDVSQRATAIAQRALALAEQGHSLFGALDICARAAGLKPDSVEFDDAAALVGFPYCRVLDLYMDPETKRRAEELGFAQAHRALTR